MQKAITLTLTAIAVVVFVGCRSSSNVENPIQDSKGEVVAVNKAERKVTVDLEKAQEYGKTERVNFDVADTEILAGLVPGDKIECKYRNDSGNRTLIGLRIVVAVDTEYFCPMHPRVVRNIEVKCPICWMLLSKRKKDPAAEDADVESTIQKMSPEDRAQVKAQRFCPMLNHVRLAVDGMPVKLALDGKTLFVCCDNCVPLAKADSVKTLKQLQTLLEQNNEVSSPDQAEKKIRAALSKLTADDRKRSDAQRFCPVTGATLGLMGVPEKVTLDSDEIFLCCSGCKPEAVAYPGKTLKKVRDLRASLPQKR